MSREDEIRLMAYQMWTEEGCPTGCDCEHWYKAETQWESEQRQQNQPAKKASTESSRRSSKTMAARKKT